MAKIYVRSPEYTDEEGTYARVFQAGSKNLLVNNKDTGLSNSSAVLKLTNKRIEIRNGQETLSFKLDPMPKSVLAWVWTLQPKYRPGDKIRGFTVIRERLNPYIMALRKSQVSGMIRLINKDSKEVIKALPINFSKMVFDFTFETSEYMKTGRFAVETVDQNSKVLGTTDIEITRFEKKEILIQADVPRWILLGDDATITVKGQYFHGAQVEKGSVTLELPGRIPITQSLEKGTSTIILDNLTEGVHNFSLRLEDEQGRSDTVDCQIQVSTQSGHFKIILPEERLYSKLPFTVRVRLETPEGLPISNCPIEINWRYVGKLLPRDLPDLTKVLPTDINGYIEFSEVLEWTGSYILQINTIYNNETISAVESLSIERLVEGHLFIENKLDQSVFSEGEKITGKIQIKGHPETIKKVKYGFVDLISDRVLETKRIEIKNPKNISYEFEGIADFYGPICVEFYVNNTVQSLGLIDSDNLDKAGCLVAKSNALVELSMPLEVKMDVEAPESTPTGSSVKISVNIDSTLLSEDFWVFGALIDERILTSHHSSNITSTFLTAPSPLKIVIRESQPPRPPVMLLGGAPPTGGVRRGIARAAGAVRMAAPMAAPPRRTMERSKFDESEDYRGVLVNEIKDQLSKVLKQEKEAPEVILRTNFAESVVLQPVQIKDGKGIFEITVPDAVTKFRIMIFGAGTMQFGQSFRTIIVRNPVFTQILNSAEMVLKDRLDIRCIVQNTTNEPISGLKLFLRSMTNLALAEEIRHRTLEKVPAQSASVIPWRMIASEVGPADVELELTTPKFTEISRLDQPLYIIPPGEPVIQRMQAYMDASTPLHITWTLEGNEAFALGVVNCLPAMELAVIEGLEALARYPYGCCEQTSASTMPNIIVYEYLAAADNLSEEMKSKLVNNMEGGLQRYLTIFRGSSGGFGLWNGDNPSVFHTGLALSVIGRMRPYVSGIPDDLFSAALDYLKVHKKDKHWKSERSLETPFPSTLSDPAMTAYILNSLVLGDIEDVEVVGWMNDHLSEYKNDPTTLALLLEAWARTETYKGKFPDLGQQIRNYLVDMATGKEEQVYWTKGSSLTSEIESTAYVLMSLATAFPTDASLFDLLQKGINYLMSNRQTNGWQSTRDTLYASMAVSKVATADKPNFELQLYLNDELRFKEKVTPETMAWKIYDLRNMYLDRLQSGQNSIKVTLEGSGKCHCVFELQKWYFDLKVQAKPLAVTVDRHLSSTDATLDEEIIIDIECDPQEPLEALLIEQPIPALLQFPDDSLKKLENELEHIEVNNNKVAIFFSRLESKTKISLPFKVVFTGECRVEPVQVYGMYEPDRRVEVPPVQFKSK
ncbi:MAG: alpha-2-macroglobulin family protein [Candidatus Hodarchaeota archaeon]